MDLCYRCQYTGIAVVQRALGLYRAYVALSSMIALSIAERDDLSFSFAHIARVCARSYLYPSLFRLLVKKKRSRSSSPHAFVLSRGEPIILDRVPSRYAPNLPVPMPLLPFLMLAIARYSSSP